MKKIAIILSGCGSKDGSEITESVCTLLALTKRGTVIEAFAPSHSFSAVNHIDGQKVNVQRNSMEEAARIMRGSISNIKNLKAHDFDGLVIPGGQGAATLLSDWATKGSQCKVETEVARVIKEFHTHSNPIGAICMAPVLLAKVLGDQSICITLGEDENLIREVTKTGVIHEKCAVDDFISDRDNKILTTPAYMYSQATPFQVFTGIQKMIDELFEMA
jgi:enhancing lycopene biosynthesis protein 2